ncbi:alpha/beta fold hydrolase [Shewanella aestuarii]|uniref:Alpha/beta fold hydrolase n=1 Tax=Shewanella aestuarii TaxID=1028752 RepID=A0A6G9QP38_9GAMM|nr:alpha/beta fold hydrolase [Shewanella aestuarii]QIR16168.1 alpha/beta fold hydrolase [Shewanella aestuarii]
MNYAISGKGQPVILLHGLFGNLDNLKSLAKALENRFQVIRVDLPNHGQSPHWSCMDYPALAQAVIDLMNELSLKSAKLVGHSMGGKVAMATALLNPLKIDALVVADIAPVTYHPRHQTVFAGLTSLVLNHQTTRVSALNHLINAGIEESVAQFLLKNLQRTETGFEWKMNLTGLINSYDRIIGWQLQDCSTPSPYNKPCLFIRGGESDYVTADHREQILEQFPSANVKTLNGTGHWLHAQKPEIFNRIVAEFLAN